MFSCAAAAWAAFGRTFFAHTSASFSAIAFAAFTAFFGTFVAAFSPAAAASSAASSAAGFAAATARHYTKGREKITLFIFYH